ncbi:MAG: sulfate adenylyltransferase subunit CysN [Janthinobacterium lividum]
MAHLNNDLVELHLTTPAVGVAANGAPVGEPEAWNENIAVYTPLQGHTPEPEPVTVSQSFADNFDIGEYLQEERGKDLLRFSTAGSVDDGKSTLIGRLLYDTQSVYDDQLQSIEGKGTTAPGVLDLALLTDGLRAEREQGITIDVAYRYFSTARRKFIIADTPGHEQYTRNMATGASTADVAVVLVDARKGVLVQSRRHAYITALLGVRNVIVAVNKMDLVGYAAETFKTIEADFQQFFRSLDVDGNADTALHFVPVSALAGDNVVHASAAMPWYAGPTMLGLLETIPSSQVNVDAPFRMAVQRVVRPDLDFRGFAGQIATGVIHVGDAVTALPSGRNSRVRRIVTFDGDLQEAIAPLSVTLTLEDEIDISRGDLLAAASALPAVSASFTASLVWMSEIPLEIHRRYLLKQGSRSLQASVTGILRSVDLSSLTSHAGPDVDTASLGMNGIAEVSVETLQPLAFDTYAANRHTGSFVLIDLQSNATVAAGMIRRASTVGSANPSQGFRDVLLKPAHPLRLQGSAKAIALALDTLRNADVLVEEQ